MEDGGKANARARIAKYELCADGVRTRKTYLPPVTIATFPERGRVSVSGSNFLEKKEPMSVRSQYGHRQWDDVHIELWRDIYGPSRYVLQIVPKTYS